MTSCFFLDGRPADLHASAGADPFILVLSLKIAEIQYLHELLGDPPVLLLDDVSSELDREKNAALFAFLRESPSQGVHHHHRSGPYPHRQQPRSQGLQRPRWRYPSQPGSDVGRIIARRLAHVLGSALITMSEVPSPSESYTGENIQVLKGWTPFASARHVHRRHR